MLAYLPEAVVNIMETTTHVHYHQGKHYQVWPEDGDGSDNVVAIENITSATHDSEIVLMGVHNYPLVYQILIGIVIAVVAIVTFFGNMLVVIAFITQRKLRTFGNYFILNLAFTDLIVGVLMGVYLPTMLVGSWIYGREVCTLFILFDYIVPLASSWNIAVISFDRYWCASHPTDYRLKQSPRLAVGIMSIPWVAGTLTFVPGEIYFQFFNHPYEVPVNQCYIAFYKYTPYLVFTSSMEFIVPFVVVLVLNVLLCANIMKRSHQAKRYRSPHLAQSRLKRDKNAAKSLGILVVIFGITWGPFEICQLLNALCHDCMNAVLYELAFWMLWINSTVNPIIYALLQERFRIAFKKVIFMFWCSCKPAHRKIDGPEYTEYQTRLLLNGDSKSNRGVELQIIKPKTAAPLTPSS